MQNRTYFASSVPAALEAARRDLGPDAVLVGSRPAPPAMRDLGKLEVSFQMESGPSVMRRPAAVRDESLLEIREELQALRHAMGLKPPAPKPAEKAPLIATEVPIRPFGPVPPNGCRRIAMIGPAGRGKTTSLVKIAMRFGLANRVPVRIYSVGAQGIGAQEQLARYAAILGVPYQSFEAPESLHLALDGDAWKGLVLIDTPGLSPGEVLEAGSLARFFGRRPEIEKHLVLRSEASSADSLDVVARFSSFQPQRLLFTGLDEAPHWAQIGRLLSQTGIPGTFAGIGPEIPEGIEELREERFRSAPVQMRAATA